MGRRVERRIPYSGLLLGRDFCQGALLDPGVAVHPTLQRLGQDLTPQRLGHVVVHARVETTLAVSGHGVGGQSDDGDVAARGRLDGSDGQDRRGD